MALDTLATRSRHLALFERYGALLTQHQQEVLDLSLRSDWSLAEIAGHQGTSRAAVHDIVKRSTDALEEFERRLGLLAEAGRRRRKVASLERELVEVLGGNSEGLRYAPAPPTVLMLIGLQGSGKTTTAVKLALLARREAHKPMVVALDLRRPAAVEQLRTLADREGVGFYSAQGAVEDITRSALTEASRLGQDVVILDPPARLHIDAELIQELKRLETAVPLTATPLV